MVVVDTNVLAYLLIEGDQTAQARRLLALDPEWISEPFLLIEFSNVLATYVRLRGLTNAQAAALLVEAEACLRGGWHEMPHAEALKLAAEHAVSAYDARFLGVARQFRQRLVTEDSRLRAAAPGLTQSLAEAVRAASSRSV